MASSDDFKGRVAELMFQHLDDIPFEMLEGVEDVEVFRLGRLEFQVKLKMTVGMPKYYNIKLREPW